MEHQPTTQDIINGLVKQDQPTQVYASEIVPEDTTLTSKRVRGLLGAGPTLRAPSTAEIHDKSQRALIEATKVSREVAGYARTVVRFLRETVQDLATVELIPGAEVPGDLAQEYEEKLNPALQELRSRIEESGQAQALLPQKYDVVMRSLVAVETATEHDQAANQARVVEWRKNIVETGINIDTRDRMSRSIGDFSSNIVKAGKQEAYHKVASASEMGIPLDAKEIQEFYDRNDALYYSPQKDDIRRLAAELYTMERKVATRKAELSVLEGEVQCGLGRSEDIKADFGKDNENLDRNRKACWRVCQLYEAALEDTRAYYNEQAREFDRRTNMVEARQHSIAIGAQAMDASTQRHLG